MPACLFALMYMTPRRDHNAGVDILEAFANLGPSLRRLWRGIREPIYCTVGPLMDKIRGRKSSDEDSLMGLSHEIGTC
jgi:hypothetical protein